MKLRYTRRASADLEPISVYMSEHSPTGARSVLSRIRKAVEQLALQPLSGQSTNRGDIRVCFIGRYPYKIFYRISGEEIQIVHIRHTARRPFDTK